MWGQWGYPKVYIYSIVYLHFNPLLQGTRNILQLNFHDSFFMNPQVPKFTQNDPIILLMVQKSCEPVEVGSLSTIIYDGCFHTFQVVGLGISEPSTVWNSIGCNFFFKKKFWRIKKRFGRDQKIIFLQVNGAVENFWGPLGDQKISAFDPGTQGTGSAPPTNQTSTTTTSNQL